MPQQYQQNNVNVPRLARTLTQDTVLNFDDDMVVANTSVGNPVTLTLPSAQQIPGQTIVVKVTSGSVAPVVIEPIAGETIDGLNFITISTDQTAVVLRALGTVWYLICCITAGPEECDDPVVLTVTENQLAGTIELRGVQFGTNPIVELVDPATGAVTVPTVTVLPDVGSLNVLEFPSAGLNAAFITIRDGESNCINFAGELGGGGPVV